MSTAISQANTRYLLLGFSVVILGLASFLFFNYGMPGLGTKKVAEVTRTQDFQDWRLECRGAPEQCAVAQFHIREDNKKLALKVIAVKGSKNGMEVPVLRVVAPLGIRLSEGLSVKVDESKEVKVPFGACAGAGCVAEFGAGGQFLEDVRAGRIMRVTYIGANGKPVAINVSLSGFNDAMAALPSSPQF